MGIKISSLKVKLLLWVLPIVIFGMIIMSIVAFGYINMVIEQELTGNRQMVIDRSAEMINRWLVTMMLEPETIASTPAAKNINNSFSPFDLQNINRYKVLHKKYPDIFQDIYGSNREGVYHTVVMEGNQIKFFEGSIANRPYFISIMNGGPTQITPPLISRTTGIPTVFIVAPIIDENNEPAGLVGTGVALTYIQQLVRGMKLGKSDYGFIYTSDGTLVAHSKLELVIEQQVNILDLFPDPDLVIRLRSEEKGMFHYRNKNKDVIFFHNLIPVTGWKMVSVISTSELFYPASRMIQILILITAITSIITGISVYYIMGRLIKPLQIFVQKTGEIAEGNFSAGNFLLKSNDEIGVLAQSFNTMQKNLQDSVTQLKESEQNYRSIFENSMEGILQTSINGKILTVNPATVQMFHCESVEKLMGSSPNIQQLYYNPEDRKQIIDTLIKKGHVNHKEVQARGCDGSIIWISLSAYLVRDESGAPLRIESLISDISEQKKIEEEKEKLFQELIQAQKLEAVGQLAGGIAHDFNNMLAVILGRAELSLLTMDKTDPNYESFVDIYDAAEHSGNLTRQLLAFARKQSVAPEVLKINSIINSMFKLLLRLINEDIELTFTPDNDIWDIYMDPDQLGQILTNLCVNARDAIKGNGRITIKTENLDIDSNISELMEGIIPGQYICLSVEDSGSGMDTDMQKHIFEPFFTTKEQGKGTGLGLSTIYGIVKQNKGLISVYSELEKGTIFKVYLPRLNAVEKDSDQNDLDEKMAASIGSILLVEDDQRLLGITKVILESLGSTVIPAGTPAEAIQIAENSETPIDLLMTDVIMPEMNGHELFKRIDKIRPELKCLFMSGYSADILAPKGVLKKGINFIQKPFSLKGISDKINEIMKNQ